MALADASLSGQQLLETIETSTADNRLLWQLTPKQITELADAIIARATETLDAVAAAKDNPTREAILDRIAHAEIVEAVSGNTLDFPSSVSPNKEVRDASTAADKKVSAFWVQASMRLDVYEAVSAFAETEEAKALKGEDARLLERMVRDGRRNGLHLDEEKRAALTKKKERMSELKINYQQNLNEESSTFEFAEEELAGMPGDYMSSLKKNDAGDKYIVNLKYPCYFPLMKMCKVEATRRKMEFEYNSRCREENTAILEELVVLRQEIATILGYDTHAAFITEIRMAKSPQTINTFLRDVGTKLKPLMEQEKAVLLRYKEEEKKELGEEFDGKLHAWDVRHYLNIVEEKEYSIDHEVIKEYFPLDVVTKGMLDIYQQLLSLRFEEVSSPVVWQEDVRHFRVFDAASSELVGEFYLDLFPREGKYGHAACFGLQPGCLLPSGKRQVPVAACVTNFTKPLADKPSLLLHNEVETFFHEFGHVMHQLCSKADKARFAGTAVERDFVEAPSQMLENWCWEPEALARMSGHYKNTDKPLPADLADTLIKSRNANKGILDMRQLILGLFDQTIHQMPKADTAAEFAKITMELWGIPATPGTNMAASFGHLAGGYDAQYYGYMWSEVYSADMFGSRFAKEGIFNPKVGMDYRNMILSQGGSRDAADMIRDFLGREPNSTAFLQSKGLSA